MLLLEGGYNFQSLSEGVCNSFQALTGGQTLHEFDSSAPAEPAKAVDEVINEVVAIHNLEFEPHWPLPLSTSRV